MFDGKAFGEEMVVVVRGFVERAIEQIRAEAAEREAALEARIAAMEAREAPAAFDPVPLQEGFARLAEAVGALPGEPDLSGLATKAELAEVRDAIPAPADLSDRPTKAEMAEAIAAIPAADLSGLATKEELAAQDMETLRTIKGVQAAAAEARQAAGVAIAGVETAMGEIAEARAAIPAPADLSGLATKEELAAVEVRIPETNGFATKAELAEVRESIPAPVEAQDLSGFATKAELQAIPEPKDFGREIEALAERADRDRKMRDETMRRDMDAALADVRAEIPEVQDLSHLATKADVAAVLAAIPGPTDVSELATKAELDEVAGRIVEPVDFGPAIEAVRAVIPDVSGLATKDEVPDISGLATQSEVADLRAAIPDVSDLATKADVAAVREAIPGPVDLSEVATKAGVAEAIGAIRMPEAINGKDADPEEVAAIVTATLEPRVAEMERAVAERVATVKDGTPGRDGTLPVVEPWSDRVYYRSAVVSHAGSLWQASTDTGREPPHADWTCLAAKGEDGLTPEFVGTHEDGGEYRRLDVVALNGGSFVALRDAPGPCPGDGWQLLVARGKPGQAVKGEKGDRGDDAGEIIAFHRDGEDYVVTFGDGRELRA